MNEDVFRLITQVWQPLKKQELFNGDPSSVMDHSAYVDYYTKQWYLMMGGHDINQHPVSTTPDKLLALAQQIHAGKGHVELVDYLEGKGGLANPTHPTAEDSINLALRLVSMIKFGTARRQIMPRRYMDWDQGCLKEYLTRHFSEPPELNCDLVRFPKSFHVWNIERIGGIDICFTDNLADHLLLVEDGSKLLIFHYASFLEYQQDMSSPIFPDGFVNETLRTIALIFPEAQFGRNGTPGGRWFRQKRLKEAGSLLDGRLTHCGNLQMEERQIERFTFWRDRLVILKQAYDDATPGTISQWWHDRRNGVQWYTFWVAILVLVLTTLLGLVQCVEGALQVYNAYIQS